MRTPDRSLAEAKRELRREMRARLSALPHDRVRQAGEALLERFGGLPQRLFAFASTRGETNTWPLLYSRWEGALPVALPRVEPEGIAFFSVTGPRELSPGTLGIAEPGVSCSPVRPAAGDTVLVPGLAFTRDGDRLGRGGGYYDRFLATLAESVHTIGICYDAQLRESLPRGGRDVRVGSVVAV